MAIQMTKNMLDFKDEYFYYAMTEYHYGLLDTDAVLCLRGVYNVKDLKFLRLSTDVFGTILDVCRIDRSCDSTRLMTFYIGDYDTNRDYYDTLVHNVNVSIKKYEDEDTEREDWLYAKWFLYFVIGLIVITSLVHCY
jgi:hypothetical protein